MFSVIIKEPSLTRGSFLRCFFLQLPAKMKIWKREALSSF